MNPTLTRRDAIAALVAGGVGIGGSALLVSERTTDTEGSSPTSALSDADVSTLVALTDVLYPSAVTAAASFVETYVGNLSTERREAIVDSIRRLDDGARRHTGSDFADLASSEKREAVLRRMGVDTVRSSSSGTPPERIRYHLVNSLLYALFTSPRGSELVGIENPTGHPGGYEVFSREPEADDR